MKKKKNIRVAALVMIFTMFFGVTAQTTYAKEINTIDFEYYSQTLISEYAKYGIEIEMEPVEGFVYTQELLEFELAKVEDYAEKSKAFSDEPVFATGYATDDINSSVSTCAMYTTISAYADGSFIDTEDKPFVYLCSYRVTASFYVDAQRNEILSAYAPSVEVMSATGYDDYASLQSYSVSIDNSSSTISKHNATYTMNVLFKKSLSIGGVTSWEKVSKTVVVTIYPFE